LADVATGNVLRAGGVGVAPAYGKVNLTTDVTGVLPFGNGGVDTLVSYGATSTIVGWSSFTTQIIEYIEGYNYVLVFFDLNGTSNSTTTSFTLPFNNASAVSIFGFDFFVVNNGQTSTSSGRATIAAGGSTIDFRRDGIGATWTNSGTKRIAGKFFYPK
jgi:hypothetical protein